jgi:hypothetical protein
MRATESESESETVHAAVIATIVRNAATRRSSD